MHQLKTTFFGQVLCYFLSIPFTLCMQAPIWANNHCREIKTRIVTNTNHSVVIWSNQHMTRFEGINFWFHVNGRGRWIFLANFQCLVVAHISTPTIKEELFANSYNTDVKNQHRKRILHQLHDFYVCKCHRLNFQPFKWLFHLFVVFWHICCC